MEEGVRSGGVLKKKSSSGCLIIKKKGDGMGGVGPSGSRKDKKRSRLIRRDSGSSDELLEPSRRKVTGKCHNGSVEFRKNIVDNREFVRNGEFGSEETKGSRLDLFEFNEYDEFDGKMMRNDYMIGRRGSPVEFGSGSSRNVMGGRNKGVNYNVKSMLEGEEDEAHLPISSLRREKFQEASDKPIRLQGKNGVLKVMVNKKKMGLSHSSYNHQEVKDRTGSRSGDAFRKNTVARPSSYSDSKHPEKTVTFVKTEKSEMKLRKSLQTKSSKGGDLETDTSLKLRPSTVKACDAAIGVKNEGKKTPLTENTTTGRSKERKISGSVGTDKQILREQIRDMLIKAGWTIDYRPRRNRDYLDAVYINPSGTAYWSIIKAYDALQKQMEEEGDNTKPGSKEVQFSPLSGDLLNKLTRRTRKKIEKETKKRRDDGLAEGSDNDQHEDTLSFYMRQNGKSLRGRLQKADHVSGDDLNENATNSRKIQGRKSRIKGRCTLLVRSSDEGQDSETEGYVSYTGKRTLLAWLIDSGTVKLSEKVQYMNRRRTKVMLEGWITKDGIHCGCCSKILTVSKFEIHAGTKKGQPYQNIVLESGFSLLQCQIDAWNRQQESERQGFYTIEIDGDDPDDDTCGICGDGGDLICCDGCPSTFHQSCLDIQMLPLGDWHCPNCTCIICGIVSGGDAEENSRTVESLITCSLCEKKYHESCCQKMNSLPADSNNASTSFCSNKCQEIFDHLQNLLGVKHEMEAGFSWSLIRRTDLDLDAFHHGSPQRVECNSKLAVALSIMNECFLSIVDRRSGINLIHNVLYNCGLTFLGILMGISRTGLRDFSDLHTSKSIDLATIWYVVDVPTITIDSSTIQEDKTTPVTSSHSSIYGKQITSDSTSAA
ncbi:unnamed protein product [Ilex paraguariensis]|uniref:PHD-type domain-containing protein n=3 Tax=Ilex paraguariensis TaxID=185542 RepID=A0ABC8UZ44_9AQUA